MRRLLPFLLALAVLAGCGGGDAKKKGGAGSSASRDTAKTVNGCERVAGVEPKGPQHLAKPTSRLDPGKTWTVTLKTSCGTFAIRLAVRQAPKTTSSFASLVKRGFYDGLTFHRISQGFVIQGGDPQGDGQGGPGYSVQEPPPKGVAYTRGTVAMAKTQTEPRGTSGSQFFVITAEDATATGGLTPDYALLGKVVSGADVVQRIGTVDADPQTEQPRQPIVIRKATLQSR